MQQFRFFSSTSPKRWGLKESNLNEEHLKGREHRRISTKSTEEIQKDSKMQDPFRIDRPLLSFSNVSQNNSNGTVLSSRNSGRCQNQS